MEESEKRGMREVMNDIKTNLHLKKLKQNQTTKEV
jgi:hypothetical protein